MTIKDIARLAGCSVGTVSRVLNNHPDVSDAMRKKVMEVVEEQGFQPNTNARHLKMQASSAVALVVKGTSNMLFADLVERTQAMLVGSGEETVVCYLDEDADEVAYAVQLCRERRPKGILFLGGDLENFARGFGQLELPCVLLTNSARELGFSNLSSLTTDDTAAAAQAIEYLLSQGHTRIGILGGSAHISSQIGYSRLQGGLQSLRRHKVEFDLEKQYEPCRYSLPEGYAAAQRLLSRCPDLTAVFALSDVMAIGVMRALQDMGRTVPADVSLMGYDGIAIARYCVPRLATICQDTGRMARRGVEMLLHRIYSQRPAAHELVPFQLIRGESVLPLFPDTERLL